MNLKNNPTKNKLRPPDPKSILVLKYPCQKIKIRLPNSGNSISKQLPPKRHHPQQKKPTRGRQPLRVVKIWYLHQDLDSTTDQG